MRVFKEFIVALLMLGQLGRLCAKQIIDAAENRRLRGV